MRMTGLEKKTRLSRRKNGQHILAFSAIAVLLYFTGFPIFFLFFVGVLAFFIWKAFSLESDNETKRIFDLYLSASEILRSDERRWFGFEVRDAIAKGDAIVRDMSAPPPLVYFVMGALNHKAGDHQNAIKYLSAIAGENASDESSIVYPSNALSEYVRTVREIERNPAEAPLTSAALRSLERLRKRKAEEMLKASVSELEKASSDEKLLAADNPEDHRTSSDIAPAYNFAEFAKNRTSKADSPADGERRTISEVLHDIYDEKAEG